MSEASSDTWTYEPDENPKRKHSWDRNEAGFVLVQGKPVGKCPNSTSLEEAERLLNDPAVTIHYSSPRWGKPFPERIYIVRDGVVYRAKPTVPGRSYHAFPEMGERIKELPTKVREQIMDRARELRCEEAVRRWIGRRVRR